MYSRQSFLKRAVYLAGVTFTCVFMAGGCTNEDDLSIQNDYDFPITLKNNETALTGKPFIQIIGTVSAHTTHVFQGGAGPHGVFLDGIEMEDAKGKQIGKLSQFSRQEHELPAGCAGNSSLWSITVGPGLKQPD